MTDKQGGGVSSVELHQGGGLASLRRGSLWRGAVLRPPGRKSFGEHFLHTLSTLTFRPHKDGFAIPLSPRSRGYGVLDMATPTSTAQSLGTLFAWEFLCSLQISLDLPISLD